MLKSTSGLYLPTLKEESDFERDLLRPPFMGDQMSKEEALSSFQLGLRLEVGHHDKRGRYIREQSVEGHSIVQQWPTWLTSALNQTSVQSLKDTSNTLRTLRLTDGAQDWRSDGAANSATKGILCGTGTTAVTITDYALETAIANGVGAGQLQWAADVFAAISSSGTSRLITQTRAFTNNSAGAINVTEVAFYAQAADSGSTQRTFCMCRDLLSFTIGIGATKTVTYQFTVALT